MYDIISVGEIVIDFSVCGKGPMDNPAYEMNPGGAPANVLVAATALGAKTAFIGMVGNDLLGNYLLKTLERYGIDNHGMRQTNDAYTNMTFVNIAENGERSFSFLKGSGTDYLLRPEDIDYSIIEQSKAMHIPVGLLRFSPGREALLAALDFAKSHNKLISFDPNYRKGMWATYELAKKDFDVGVKYADILKLSEEEMSIITGRDPEDYEAGAKQIFDMGKKAVFITMGAKGSYYVTDHECGFVESFNVKAVDTTACGDAFLGTALYYITRENGLAMHEIVRRANAAGALCATKPGAFDAMPSAEELAKFLSI